jgi:ankyrin repeat protein
MHSMREKEFFKAVKAGDEAATRTLLADEPGLINARDADKSTPLHYAAWKGHAGVIEILLDAGADIGAHNENDHWGTTPLHAAAHANNKDAAAVLIRRGANVNAARAAGSGTPLAETRVHNATAVAKLLREAGATE